jgi:hypothetical protein
VAHPVGLGWPAVLGRPYAVFTVAAYTSALLLAVSVLPVSDSGLRQGATVVLIGLAGAGAGVIMQLRQVLASPAVAEDEASLVVAGVIAFSLIQIRATAVGTAARRALATR